MNKSEQKAVDRALPLVATHPAAVAATLATLHRSTLARRTKDELENLIEQHGLWPHLSQQHGVIVPREQPALNWPFPRASASAPPTGRDLADPAPF